MLMALITEVICTCTSFLNLRKILLQNQTWYNRSFQHEQSTFGKRCSYLMRSIQADSSMGVSSILSRCTRSTTQEHPTDLADVLYKSNHTCRSESMTPRKKQSFPALSGSCWRRRSPRVPRKNEFHRVSGLATPMVHSPLTPEIGLRELEDHTGIYGRGGRRRGTKLVIP